MYCDSSMQFDVAIVLNDLSYCEFVVECILAYFSHCSDVRCSCNMIQYILMILMNGTPKSSILIGFSIIFTIHFGGKIPIFLETSI